MQIYGIYAHAAAAYAEASLIPLEKSGRHMQDTSVPHSPTSSAQQLGVQLASSLSVVVVMLDVSVVNVALDSLHLAFGASITGLQWIINSYALVFAALLLSAGALGDRLGSKRVFMLGTACFTAASVLCGLATQLPMLVAARALQGLGAALLLPNSLALLQQAFKSPLARSRAVGWWGAAGGAALAAGPVIGGVLISSLGWRSVFWLNLPIGLLTLWLAQRYAPRSALPAVARPLDLPGQALAILALASLTYALTEASRQGWGALPVVGCLLVFAIAAGVFIGVERHSAAPMLPASLFAQPVVGAATAIGLIINFAFYGMVFVLSLLFQTVRHWDAQHTGMAFLPMMGVLMLANLLATRLAQHVGARWLAAAGLLMSAIGYLLLLPTSMTSPYAQMVAPMLLAGMGIAITVPTITNATLGQVPSGQVGIASGMLNSARQVGGVLGVAVFGFLAQGSGAVPLMAGMHLALALSAAMLVVGAVLAMRYLRPAAGGSRV